MATYYHDTTLPWKSPSTADVAVDDTVIHVEDGSIFAGGQIVWFSGVKYTVDSVSGNDITLTTAVTTAGSAGVELVIDDLSWDGLTPQTAKRSGSAYWIFDAMSGSGNADRNTVWVRRGANIFTHGVRGVRHVDVIFWPIEGEAFYNERPQEAIDAGWDNDSGKTSYVHVGTDHFDLNASDSTVSINNVEIDADNGADDGMFVTQGNVTFRHCKITNRRTNTELAPIIQHWTGYNMYARFYNCDIYAAASIMSRDNGAGGTNAMMYLYMQDCDIDAGTGLRAYCSKDYEWQNHREIHIVNSNAVFRDRVFVQQGRHSYINGRNYIRIEGSIVHTERVMYWYTTDYNYGMSPLKVEVINSELYSNQRAFHFYHRNWGGHESNSYETIKFKNSKLVCGEHFMLFERPDQTAARLKGPIIFENCEIDVVQRLVHVYGNLSEFNKFIFTGNKIINATYLLRVDCYVSGTSTVNINGAHINGHALENIDYVNGVISNSYISGYAAVGDMTFSNIKMRNVDTQGISVNGKVDIDNCIIGRNDSANRLDNISGTIRNSKLRLSGAKPLVNGKVNLNIINCDIEGDFDSPRNSEVRIFDSRVNGASTTYLAHSNNVSKKIVPIFRIGGSDISLEVNNHSNFESLFYVDEIRGTLEDGKTKIEMYFVSNMSRDALENNFLFRLTYEKNDGGFDFVGCTIEEDNLSQWDGIPSGLMPMKAYVDFEALSLVPFMSQTNRDMLFEISASPSYAGAVKLIFDLDVKSLVQ